MIQRGRANGTDIISTDMTLEAVPLQLLSHFSPTCTVIVRQHLARPVTMAVSTVKTPRQISGNPLSGQLYTRLIPSQSVETTDSWPEPMEQKPGTRKKVPGEYHWLIFFSDSFFNYEDLDVECRHIISEALRLLNLFRLFQWRSSMHQIHRYSL